MAMLVPAVSSNSLLFLLLWRPLTAKQTKAEQSVENEYWKN